jgi:hypothetical protein
MSGAIYCSNCGTQLVDRPIAAHNIRTFETRHEVLHDSGWIQPPSPPHMQSRISLNMIESGQILPLADRTEFTLGRSAEGQPIVPDVDLSSLNAYEHGVSRLHALLKLIQEQVVVMDLGSSNGTYLKGSRLIPYVETPVAHGDVILLGKLKIQVLIE